MSKPDPKQAAQTSNVFQFTLAGLILFSLALVLSASFVTYKLQAASRPNLAETFAVDAKDKSHSVHVGPWGTLVTRDIDLERPVEYLTDEVNHPPQETWRFEGQKPEAVQALLAKNGLSAAQISVLLAPANASSDASGTLVKPPGEFLESLGTATRQKLYVGMAGFGVNMYLDFPFIFPGNKIETIYADARLHPDDVALLKRLVYPNAGAFQLGDSDYLLSHIPTLERRIAMTRSISRQSAVLAGLAIRSDTDIDKVASYWGNVPNVRFTDIRPMLESLKQLPGRRQRQPALHAAQVCARPAVYLPIAAAAWRPDNGLPLDHV